MKCAGTFVEPGAKRNIVRKHSKIMKQRIDEHANTKTQESNNRKEKNGEKYEC